MAGKRGSKKMIFSIVTRCFLGAYLLKLDFFNLGVYIL